MTLQAPATAPDSSAAEDTMSQLEAKLERYLYLQKMQAEFEKLKKEIKPLFEGQDSITIGRFEVVGSYIEQPERVMRACRYWNMRIKPAVDCGCSNAGETPE